MESYQVTVSYGNNKIEFNGVKPKYAIGEAAGCTFVLPGTYKHELGDWIGIYPVGWSKVGHYTCRKMVKPEHIWSSSSPVNGFYGRIEFEPELLPKPTDQYYQFVYVKNGDYVWGVSAPFMFAPYEAITTSGFRLEEPSYKPYYETYYGGKSTPFVPTEFAGFEPTGPTGSVIPTLWAGSYGGGDFAKPKWFEYTLVKEMQNIQASIGALEQGLNTPTSDEFPPMMSNAWWPSGYGGNWTVPTSEYTGKSWWPAGELPEPYQVKKYWQARIGEMQQMLGEQVRLEQTQRRLEQLNMIAHMKSYERFLMGIQRKESEIRDYMFSRIPKQVAEFEQKVYNVAKMIGESASAAAKQPETYVKRYEQMLREKVEWEQHRRLDILVKLRRYIRECERKFREMQTLEYSYYNRYQQMLKQKFGLFESKYVQPSYWGGAYTDKTETELREQFKGLLTAFVEEQRKEQHMLFVKEQKHMLYIINEIFSRLQELGGADYYAQFKIPGIYSWSQFENDHTYYGKIRAVENQLYAIKAKMLKAYLSKWLAPTLTPQYFKTFVKHIFDLENQLSLEKPVYSGYVNEPWFERRAEKLGLFKGFFEEYATKQMPFDEIAIRNVWKKLKEFEYEIYEYPQFFKRVTKVQPTPHFMNILKTIERALFEKIRHWETVYDQVPIEYYVDTGKFGAWRELLQFEKKLVELKAIYAAREQYKHFYGRIYDVEQALRGNITISGVEKVLEPIRMLRTMLEQPSVFYPAYLTYTPEQFLHHHQIYDAFYHTLGNLEFVLYAPTGDYELSNPTTTTPFSVKPYELYPWKSTGGLERLMTELPVFAQQFLYNLIHQHFEKLVHEVYRQLPTHYWSKFEPIVSYFKKFYNPTATWTPYRYPGTFGQELAEKMTIFESVLGEPELEQFNWTPIGWYSTGVGKSGKEYVRYLMDQVKYWKNQVQTVVSDLVLANGGAEEYKSVVEDLVNNNNMPHGFGPYEPFEYITLPGGETAPFTSVNTYYPYWKYGAPTTGPFGGEEWTGMDYLVGGGNDWTFMPEESYYPTIPLSPTYKCTYAERTLKELETGFAGMGLYGGKGVGFGFGPSRGGNYMKRLGNETVLRTGRYWPLEDKFDTIVYGGNNNQLKPIEKINCPMCGTGIVKDVAEFDLHFETHF